MGLHVDEHSPIPIRRQLTEQLEHVIEGGDVPRDQALPQHPGAGRLPRIDLNTVARAIEDLELSEYRPLRPRPEAPEPASIGGGPPPQGATYETAKGR